MLKKTYLSVAYIGLQSCGNASPAPVGSCTSKTSPYVGVQNGSKTAVSTITNPNKRPTASSPVSPGTLRRSYASVRGSSRSPDFRDNMNWPCRNDTDSSNLFVPSPYEIFDMQRGTSYSKTTKLKYFELVKIYHPDRNVAHTDCAALSHGERLERYRLIVLAHEILSDPEKRKAYDSYGAGWGAKQSSARGYTRGYSTTTGKQYGQGAEYDSSPFANATWEDWEKWYRRNENPEQKQAYAGTFINPNAFAAFVIVAAVISGILQATRITTSAGNLSDKQLAFSEETSRFMTSRASMLEDDKLDQSGRVKAFLEKRDPSRYGLKEQEEDAYRSHFAANQNITPLGRTKQQTPRHPDARDIDIVRLENGEPRAKVSYTR